MRSSPRMLGCCGLMLMALASLGGCAAGPSLAVKEVSLQSRLGGPAAPLTESLFHKPAERDNLSEEVIRKVLDAPVDPEFPARAGVVILSRPFTRSAYPAQEPGDEAPQLLAREIERSRHFALVSDISPYLADGQHIESLRELATRYRLKYLVVMNVRYADRSHLNSWGWGWLSILGIPFLPAYTLQTAGLMEATLLDVRTGTFLFTTQVHVRASERTTPFSTDSKLGELQRMASRQAAQHLARLFVGKCNRLVVEAARQRKAAAASRAPTSPASAPPAGAPGGA